MNSNQNQKNYLTHEYYLNKNVNFNKVFNEENLTDDELTEYAFINSVNSFISISDPKEYLQKNGNKAMVFDITYYKTNICQLMNSKIAQGATVNDLASDLVDFQEKFLSHYKASYFEVEDLYIGFPEKNKVYDFNTIINDNDNLIDQKAKESIIYFGKKNAVDAVYAMFDNYTLQANIDAMTTQTDNKIDTNEKVERLLFYKRINEFCRTKPSGGFFSNRKVKSILNEYNDRLISIGFTKEELERVNNANDNELLDVVNDVALNSKLLDFNNLIKLNEETNRYECNIPNNLNPENLAYINKKYQNFLNTRDHSAIKDNVVANMVNVYKMFKQKHNERGFFSKIFNSKVRKEGNNLEALEKALKQRVGFTNEKLNELVSSDTYYVQSDIANLKQSIPTLNVSISPNKVIPEDRTQIIVEDVREDNKLIDTEINIEKENNLDNEKDYNKDPVLGDDK